MLTTQKKSELRAVLFQHLDGIVTAPVAFVLHQKGVLSYVFEKQKVTLHELTEKFEANDGYLNVGLRVLASQGFLKQQLDNTNDEVIYSINDRSEEAFSHFYLYEDVFKLIGIDFVSDKSEVNDFLNYISVLFIKNFSEVMIILDAKNIADTRVKIKKIATERALEMFKTD